MPEMNNCRFIKSPSILWDILALPMLAQILWGFILKHGATSMLEDKKIHSSLLIATANGEKLMIEVNGLKPFS